MATAQARPFYKPELDLLRFCAFLMVFLYHFLPVQLSSRSHAVSVYHTGSEQGVQIFFLLSAYLITDLLLQERARTGTVHIAAFYVRRILRIWPLYLALTLTAYVCTMCHLSSGFPTAALLHFLLLSGNWYVVKYGWITSLIAPLWTISIEEQFYLLWPTISKRFGRAGLLSLSAMVILLSYGTLLLLGRRQVPEYAVRANSLVEFQYFALGTMLAVLLHGRDFRPRLAGRIALLAVSAAATWTGVMRFHLFAPTAVEPGNLVFGYGLLAMSAACIFLACLNAALPAWTSQLVYCGRISYGLYAFHFVAFAWSAGIASWIVPAHASGKLASVAHALLALLLCFGMAYVSYRFLETPFLRLKRRVTFIASRDEVHLEKTQPIVGVQPAQA